MPFLKIQEILSETSSKPTAISPCSRSSELCPQRFGEAKLPIKMTVSGPKRITLDRSKEYPPCQRVRRKTKARFKRLGRDLKS
eukprot:bmy_21575T0